MLLFNKIYLLSCNFINLMKCSFFLFVTKNRVGFGGWNGCVAFNGCSFKG